MNMTRYIFNCTLSLFCLLLFTFRGALASGDSESCKDNTESFYTIMNTTDLFKKGNEKKAVEILSKEFKCDAMAGYWLAELYASKRDFKNAFKWHKLASDKNYMLSISHLATYYAEGIYVKKNKDEFKKLIDKVYNLENYDDKYLLFLSFIHIMHTSKIFESHSCEEFDLYKKASEFDVSLGDVGLGISYENGYCVTQDFVEAARWYRKAAKKGDDTAQFFIGYCYLLGKGVEKNKILAYVWLNKSSANGDENARKLRDALVRDMTNEQIASAQQMSKKNDAEIE